MAFESSNYTYCDNSKYIMDVPYVSTGRYCSPLASDSSNFSNHSFADDFSASVILPLRTFVSNAEKAEIERLKKAEPVRMDRIIEERNATMKTLQLSHQLPRTDCEPQGSVHATVLPHTHSTPPNQEDDFLQIARAIMQKHDALGQIVQEQAQAMNQKHEEMSQKHEALDQAVQQQTLQIMQKLDALGQVVECQAQAMSQKHEEMSQKHEAKLQQHVQAMMQMHGALDQAVQYQAQTFNHKHEEMSQKHEALDQAVQHQTLQIMQNHDALGQVVECQAQAMSQKHEEMSQKHEATLQQHVQAMMQMHGALDQAVQYQAQTFNQKHIEMTQKHDALDQAIQQRAQQIMQRLDVLSQVVQYQAQAINQKQEDMSQKHNALDDAAFTMQVDQVLSLEAPLCETGARSSDELFGGLDAMTSEIEKVKATLRAELKQESESIRSEMQLFVQSSLLWLCADSSEEAPDSYEGPVHHKVFESSDAMTSEIEEVKATLRAELKQESESIRSEMQLFVQKSLLWLCADSSEEAPDSYEGPVHHKVFESSDASRSAPAVGSADAFNLDDDSSEDVDGSDLEEMYEFDPFTLANMPNRGETEPELTEPELPTPAVCTRLRIALEQSITPGKLVAALTEVHAAGVQAVVPESDELQTPMKTAKARDADTASKGLSQMQIKMESRRRLVDADDCTEKEKAVMEVTDQPANNAASHQMVSQQAANVRVAKEYWKKKEAATTEAYSREDFGPSNLSSGNSSGKGGKGPPLQMSGGDAGSVKGKKGRPPPPPCGKGGKGKMDRTKLPSGRKFHCEEVGEDAVRGTAFDLTTVDEGIQPPVPNFDAMKHFFEGGPEKESAPNRKASVPAVRAEAKVFSTTRHLQISIIFRGAFGPNATAEELGEFATGLGSLNMPPKFQLDAEAFGRIATTLPSSDEATKLQDLEGNENLRRIERLSLPLTRVTFCDSRIRALQLKVQAPSMQELPLSRINKVIEASQALCNSTTLRQLLLTVARLVGWINSGGADTHQGFALSSALGKLHYFRALREDRGLSLLHVAALSTAGGDPDEVGTLDARLSRELKVLPEASRQDLVELGRSVIQFREQANWLLSEAERPAYTEEFRVQLRTIHEQDFADRTTELENKIEIAHKQLKDTVKYFAVPIDKTGLESASQHLFTTVVDFCRSLHSAAQQILKEPERFKKLYAAEPSGGQASAGAEQKVAKEGQLPASVAECSTSQAGLLAASAANSTSETSMATSRNSHWKPSTERERRTRGPSQLPGKRRSRPHVEVHDHEQGSSEQHRAADQQDGGFRRPLVLRMQAVPTPTVGSHVKVGDRPGEVIMEDDSELPFKVKFSDGAFPECDWVRRDAVQVAQDEWIEQSEV